MEIPRIVSPDGVWIFEEGQLRSAEGVARLFEIDFFERWTFAKFLPNGALALGFESSQPWSEFGSYGNRLGGVQVATLLASRWETLALEYHQRSHDETFIPDDVVWHPRGVLAWIHDEYLCVQVLRQPRDLVRWAPLPPCDSDHELELDFDQRGQWKCLSLDAAGTILTAKDEDGFDTFDLRKHCQRRDEGPWEPLL